MKIIESAAEVFGGVVELGAHIEQLLPQVGKLVLKAAQIASE
jgi:hypothetical protein